MSANTCQQNRSIRPRGRRDSGNSSVLHSRVVRHLRGRPKRSRQLGPQRIVTRLSWLSPIFRDSTCHPGARVYASLQKAATGNPPVWNHSEILTDAARMSAPGPISEVRPRKRHVRFPPVSDRNADIVRKVPKGDSAGGGHPETNQARARNRPGCEAGGR